LRQGKIISAAIPDLDQTQINLTQHNKTNTNSIQLYDFENLSKNSSKIEVDNDDDLRIPEEKEFKILHTINDIKT